MKKVFVIGLDCAPPQILFDSRKEFPTINKLISEGVRAKMRTCDPPITVPAWMAMCSSKTAGDVGVYGFRRRRGTSYTDIELSFSKDIKVPAIWDIIAQHDMDSCLVGVPPSYPPKKINGNLISCFMTPGADKGYTYPARLKKEIEAKFGRYLFDVVFRTDKRNKLLKSLYDMTKKHFEVIRYLAQSKPWRFFMFVEIGVDRINHSFWKFFDSRHQLYRPGTKYKDAVIDYYKYIDQNIGELLSVFDDDTTVFVVSDHGAKAMKGVFCINEWLIKKSYLVLRKRPKPNTPLEKADIDWQKSKVWAWGGYDARIFLNIKQREPKGIIPRSEYEIWRSRLKKEISEIKGPQNERWDTKVYRPEELFIKPKGKTADLIVYFDDLNYRAAGTLGHKNLYLTENDTGPDDAVHDWDGVFIMYDPKKRIGKDLGTISIFDFAPTVLNILGVDIPKDMRGKSILKRI